MATINKRNSTRENNFTDIARLQQENIHQTMNKEEQVCENSAALDSDIPNIELDTVIDEKTKKDQTLNITDDAHINVTNDDEFGSFDGDDNFENFDSDDDYFGGFDDTPQPQQIFNSLQEALDIWGKLLNEIYNYKPQDSFTGNAPKSIRLYVLEEAPESLHSRLTWDSVTKHMDNDTGIPKVRWHQSEIEKLHLIALSCKRSALSPSPAMLDMTNHRPDPIDTSTPNDPPTFQSSPITEHNTTTPTSEKRSSIFGLSSLSRYLPHLSKSNLPRSPTSPISPSNNSFQPNDWTTQHSLPPSSPLTPSNSNPRVINSTYHNDLYSLQGAFNDMNITSTQVTSIPNANIKRSNTVAFSSRFKDSSIVTVSSSPPRSTSFAAMRPRPTSYHQSTDLFDLDTDIQSPTSFEFNTNFRPLIPTISSTPLSPTINNTVRRNTSPEATLGVSKASALPIIADDDFGDFAAEQGDDVFGDFFSDSKKVAPLKTTSTVIEDPFGLNSVMMMSASHSRQNSSLSFGVMSPSILSPQIMSPSPQANILSQTKTNISSVFDMLAVNDQSIVTPEDDDWGDWAF